MSKRTYFPLLMDRWVAGTRELTFEQKGFYIDLLVYLYDSGRAIKDANHAARITGCDPRTARRLLADLRQKFYLRSDGLRHKLVTEIIRNRGVIRGLGAPGIGTSFPHDPDPTLSSPPLTSDESEIEEESVDTTSGRDDAKPPQVESAKPKGNGKIPPCPHARIIALYHELCPTMTRVVEWKGEREAALRARWREHPSLDWWRGYLKYVSESDFLTGRKPGRSNRFNLAWLVTLKHFQNVIEGKYHD